MPMKTKASPGSFDPKPRHTLPAFRLVQSSRTIRRLANFLLFLLILSVISMAMLPWQQSARGVGKVVAFIPQERQQTVTSPIKGVVREVAPGLVEGSVVKRGDFIVELEPYAANMVEQLRGQMRNLQEKLATAQTKAEVYSKNEADFIEARLAAVSAAEEMVEAAKAKVAAKEQLVTGYEAKLKQAQLNYDRQAGLSNKGFLPIKEIEKLEKDLNVAKAELESAKKEVEAAEKEQAAKEQEVEQKQNEAQTKVDYARAMRADAEGQAATVNKEIADLQMKLDEMDRLVIEAPRDGTLFRMPIFERGQAVKEGDELFTIVPETTERAVELWIAGNDVPLVRSGDHVRLQFEGWPAVQFAGWPSVAVGTFGGQVVAVDATDNGKGKFRILVKADEAGAWPSDAYLRQGVRTNGWVMLRQVSLGYEIWRQLNGFPPVVAEDEPLKDDKKDKPKVKLPK